MKAAKVEVEKAVGHHIPQGLFFSGIARSVEAYDNQGFRNFRVLTLHIKDGIVEDIKYSDPYASYEAIARLELWNELSVHNLNNNWKPGATLSK
jgi:hypothetical protein